MRSSTKVVRRRRTTMTSGSSASGTTNVQLSKELACSWRKPSTLTVTELPAVCSSTPSVAGNVTLPSATGYVSQNSTRPPACSAIPTVFRYSGTSICVLTPATISVGLLDVQAAASKTAPSASVRCCLMAPRNS
jgi:hypothetical protein